MYTRRAARRRSISRGGPRPTPRDPETEGLLGEWDGLDEIIAGDDRPPAESLSGTIVPRLARPHFSDDGERVRWLREEHLPGHFPFTAGVFPYRRADEDPARMFAGEGGPARTLAPRWPRASRRHACRPRSTPSPSRRRPPAPGHLRKIGNSGVIADLDDMRTLSGQPLRPVDVWCR
jgi:methylmalonyl-CoA mutase